MKSQPKKSSGEISATWKSSVIPPSIQCTIYSIPQCTKVYHSVLHIKILNMPLSMPCQILQMFKSLSILFFDQNSINERYFQCPRGILDAIISVVECRNSLGTLYVARFLFLRDPKTIPSYSRCSLSKHYNFDVFI